MRFLVFIFLLLPVLGFTQVNLDSLWSVWNDGTRADTSRLKAMNKFIRAGYLPAQPDSAYYFAQMQYNLANAVDEKTYMAKALHIQGISFFHRHEYSKAIDYYNKSLKISKEIGDKHGVSASLNNIALIYSNQGDYARAIDYYTQCMKIEKELGDKTGVASTFMAMGGIYAQQGNYSMSIYYFTQSRNKSEENGDMEIFARALGNIGTIYARQGDYSNALDYYTQGLKMNTEIGDKKTAALNLLNIGTIYKEQGDYSKTKDYYDQSLKIRMEIFDSIGVADCLGNIGMLYFKLDDYPKAIDYTTESLKIREQIDDKKGLAHSFNDIGIIYSKQGDYEKALKNSSESLNIAKEIGLLFDIKEAALSLWEINKKLGRFKESLKMYELYIETRDSLESEENQKAVIRQEYKYEYEKQAATDSIKTAEADKVKDALLVAEQAENKQYELEAEQQEEQKMYLFAGLGLALLFGGFIFNRFRVTRKQKGIIEEQKEQVDEAFDELEEKNQEILDSINYAKRIQSAILPPTKLVKEYLNQSFILYKPKDIVAGDFYWMEPHEDGVLFAAADCTGHGVPGAMVSVVCNNGLNRSVREYGLTDPGQILDKTREIVIAEFEKSEEEVKDGMDVALVSLEGNTLKYAGAHNPLWLIRKGTSEIEEIKANKQPIGKYDEPKPYTTHTIELQEGDSFYIFSDGYADQFGGEKGKKLKAKNFKTLLLSIQNEPIERQQELINDAFETWKGSFEQLDDVCVIGVRI